MAAHSLPFGERLKQELSASGAAGLNSAAFAKFQDNQDPFARFRSRFSFPTKATVAGQAASGGDEEGSVYLAGNSLGLMPKTTPELVRQELEVWSQSAVLAHVTHPHSRPWVQIDEIVTPTLAAIVGAQPDEVACMGSLTANLHLLLTSFYKPTDKRHKIMYEGKAFPSDSYAFASQIANAGFSADSLLPVFPREGEFVIRTEDILDLIDKEGDSIAVICFGAVQYYSAEWFEMEKITKAGHAKGCLVGFDCAHAVGNVPLSLHDWGVDFAAWCSYKYLNSGPGGIAGIFVHEKWANDKGRLSGWWGHDLSSRFAMPPTFSPLPGARGWQLSNPSVLDVISLYSSLLVFQEAGQILPRRLREGHIMSPPPLLASLRERSLDLTAYLELLLKGSKYFVPPHEIASSAAKGGVSFTIITPADPARRGAQLSLLFEPVEAMDSIFDACCRAGVLGDERRPGVIRFAPVPLYNSWQDCQTCAEVLETVLEAAQGQRYGAEGGVKAGEVHLG